MVRAVSGVLDGFSELSQRNHGCRRQWRTAHTAADATKMEELTIHLPTKLRSPQGLAVWTIGFPKLGRTVRSGQINRTAGPETLPPAHPRWRAASVSHPN